MDAHRLAEERSLALHAAVVERLRANPLLLDKARERVTQWLETNEVHPYYAQRWAELLSRPLEDVCSAILDPAEQGRAMRQCSPFAGVLDSKERWAIWRKTGEQIGKSREGS